MRYGLLNFTHRKLARTKTFFDEEKLPLINLAGSIRENAFGPKSFLRYGRRNSVFPTGTFDSGAVVP